MILLDWAQGHLARVAAGHALSRGGRVGRLASQRQPVFGQPEDLVSQQALLSEKLTRGDSKCKISLANLTV